MKVQTDNSRKIRGYAIISKGDTPQIVDESTFLVPSQSENKKYTVIKGNQYKRWECDCPDFLKRGLDCKHICCVKFWLKIKEKIENREILEQEVQNDEIVCPYCKSPKIVRNGKRRNKEVSKQKYICVECKRTFVEQAFKKIKANPQTITLIMDLYYKGLSTRKIQHNLKQVFGIKISHVAIYGYIKKFTKMIDEYVNQFKANTGEMWHTDEMMVDVNGKKVWLWNSMDRDTRFKLATKITEERYTEDARSVFRESKEHGSHKPTFVVTDGLQGYKRAFSKEFRTLSQDCEHIQGKAFREKGNNCMVERLNGTVRERLKVMRGMEGIGSGELLMKGFTNYYNFVRPHMGIGNLTPSEKARIMLNLGENRWMSLIRQANK